jgi:hypothetical protein
MSTSTEVQQKRRLVLYLHHHITLLHSSMSPLSVEIAMLPMTAPVLEFLLLQRAVKCEGVVKSTGWVAVMRKERRKVG